jgi:hypothetical protein
MLEVQVRMARFLLLTAAFAFTGCGEDGTATGGGDLALVDGSPADDASGGSGPACPCMRGLPVVCGSYFDAAGRATPAYLGALDPRPPSCSVPIAAGHNGDLFACSDAGGAPTWTLAQSCANGCSTQGAVNWCNTVKLWIAFDPTIDRTCPVSESYWSCLFAHTNFNALTSAFPGGRALAWGGEATLDAPCTVGTLNCNNCGDPTGVMGPLQCIEDKTHWPLSVGDVVLYVQDTGTNLGPYCGFAFGVNSLGPVTTPAGPTNAFLALAAGGGDTPGNCGWFQAVQYHEVYEALTYCSSADSCSEVTYTFSACGLTLSAQKLSPYPNFTAANCQPMTTQ